MTIEEAVFAIIGDEAGHAIIADMGISWAVVAAMSAATTNDDPKANCDDPPMEHSHQGGI